MKDNNRLSFVFDSYGNRKPKASKKSKTSKKASGKREAVEREEKKAHKYNELRAYLWK